ncbi:MAG TPA: TonB-dependent receptor [Gemmatimonadaceae bacterium]|nr:TonB-dependent receptor [Gemmatimonadaceae bacterium]
MRRALCLLVGAGFVSLAQAGSLAAQEGVIRGRITDSTGAPVRDAVVIVQGIFLRASSGEAGDYRIERVPPGSYTMRVRRLGYAAQPAFITVRADVETRQDFTLAPVAAALAPVEVMVGSRAVHTAAEELAVPVDVFTREQVQEQGTPEPAQILSQLAPSVNFQRQSVSDATEIVRPFTMRGLSPDHTLVLIDGKRRHHTALVHYFGAGMGAGSSGVDLNALPASMIERIEVLRDGAASQYGSDAIAGVVNIVPRSGVFAPAFSVEGGQYITTGAPNKGTVTDGETIDINGAWGIPLGRGSLALFGEYRDRGQTNRAGADPEDQLVPGDADVVGDRGNIVEKRNPIPMPNYHWGDGKSKDILTFVNAQLPLDAAGNAALYAFGGFSHRRGTGFGYYRQAISSRNWTKIYPNGFLPEFNPTVKDASAVSGVRGVAGGWRYDVGGTFGFNSFVYDLENTLNTSLGPCLDTPCAPGADGVLGTADDPGIPNQTSFNAGELKLWEAIARADIAREYDVGLASPLNVALGAAYRRENYQIVAGEPASYMQGFHPDPFGDIAPAGSQVFPGLRPQDEANEGRDNIAAYLDLESSIAPKLLANVAGRFEHYSDFGSKVTGKLALRYQPTRQWTLRGALSTGFRAPSLNQTFYSQIATNFAADSTGAAVPFDVGVFPVRSPEARALGARDLQPETSLNVSAGFAFSPIQALTFTADYYWIKLDDRIMLTTSFGTDSVKAILRSIGSRAEAAQYMTNGINTRTEGVDLTGTYRFVLGSGTMSLDGVFNWTENRIASVGPLPPELQGTGVTALFDPFYEGGLNAMTRERPKWRTTFTARYAAGPWRFLGRSTSYGEYTSSLYGYTRESAQTYPSKTLLDAEVGYSFRVLGVAIGARNIFDTYPGFMKPDNSFFIFPYPSASPFGFNGRFIYTRVDVGLSR